MKEPSYSRTSLTLDQRLGLDLLHKTAGSAFGLILFEIFNLRVAYQMQNPPSLIVGALWAGLILFIARFISLKIAARKPKYPKADIQFVRATVVFTVSLAVFPVSYLLYLTHFQDLKCLFLISELILIVVTSTYTLASSRMISGSVQFVAFMALILPSLMVWYEANRSDLGSLAIAFTFFYVYLAIYSRQVVTQLSEKIEYEIALERTNKTLEESRANLLEETSKAEHASRLASLGEMAGGIAHEINNPLTVITLLSGKLEKAILNDKSTKAELLELKRKIDETTLRISKIVRGLRSFSRNGENDPFEHVSIESICTQIVDLTASRLYNDNIAFSQDHEDASVIFECQSVQISQVIFNLVQNAADAVQGSEKPWIRIQTFNHPDRIIFKVSDSGKGIAPAVAEKIFNPFFTSKEQGKGTGLGLSISLGLIKKHQGRLYLDDKASNTTFIVELPRVQSVELKKAG